MPPRQRYTSQHFPPTSTLERILVLHIYIQRDNLSTKTSETQKMTLGF
jgi:hypothetical protein